MFTVFLDTCILVPYVKADLVLRCAEKEMFAVKWSDQVLTELKEVLQRLNSSITEEKANRRVVAMNEAFPNAQITGWENLINHFHDLPDENDRHVTAAALYAKADVIVTENIRDFPIKVLTRENLFVQPMDEFMCDLWDLKPNHPRLIFSIIQNMALDYQEDWRTLMQRIANDYRMPAFARLLYDWHFDQNS